MARKPIAFGHDPRRRMRTPTQIDDARRFHRSVATAERDGDGGQIISLAEAARTLGKAYPSLAPSIQALAALGGTNNMAGMTAERQYPDMPDISPSKPPKDMLGSTGTPIYAGVVSDPAEYNTDFYWRSGIRIYDEMVRSDPQVWLMLRLTQQPILAATPSIMPASDDPMDVEIASFVETALLEGMEYETPEGDLIYTGWDDVLRHILSMGQYGFSVFELCYTVNPAGWVTWSRWLPMLARTVWRWWTNAENDLTGIQQYAFRDYQFDFVNVGVGKLARFTLNQEGSNYDGISLLRPAYTPWFYKQQIQRIEAVGIERNSIVPPVMRLPAGSPTGDWAKAKAIVQNIRASEAMGITIPETWELKGLEGLASHGRGGIQIQPTLQYYDIQIARAFGGQFVNLGSTDTGARSLDDSQKQTFLGMLQSQCTYIENRLNNGPIRRLVDYNYAGVAVYPKIQFPSLRLQDIEGLAGTITQLAQVGFLHGTYADEDFLRKLLKLPAAPKSEVYTQNPTGGNDEPGDQGQDGEGGSDGGDQNGQQGQNQQGDTTPAGGDMGDGGQQMSETIADTMTEARLLREALDAAYGRDAVERGMERGAIQLMGGHEPGYQQVRQSGGRWGVTTGPYQPHPRQPHEEQQHEGTGGHGGGGGGGSGSGAVREHNPTPHERATARASARGKAEAEGLSPAMRAGHMQRLEFLRSAHEMHAARESRGEQSPENFKAHQATVREMRSIQAKIGMEQTAMPKMAAGTRARSAKAGGENAGAKGATEGIHERAARLQREGGLKAESQPGQELHAKISGVRIDPYETPAQQVRTLVHIYGEEQLGNALHAEGGRTTGKLQEMARELGLKASASRATNLSNIVAHVTEGRYSANFPHLHEQETAAKAERAQGRAEKPQSKAAKGEQPAKAARSREDMSPKTVDLTPVGELSPGEGRIWTNDFGPKREGLDINPYARLNPFLQHRLYGDAQLEKALGVYSVSKLRTAADVVHERLTSQGIAHTRPTGRTASELAHSIAETVKAHPQEAFYAGSKKGDALVQKSPEERAQAKLVKAHEGKVAKAAANVEAKRAALESARSAHEQAKQSGNAEAINAAQRQMRAAERAHATAIAKHDGLKANPPTTEGQ